MFKKHFYINRWNIGIVRKPIMDCVTGTIENREIHWFPVLKGHQFMADPFMVYKNNYIFLFYEFLDYRNKIGKIHFAKIHPMDFGVQETGEALSTHMHLSYPYVFKEGKDFYMIPESSASHEISLYQAERFPNQWKKIHTLLPFGGIDNTPLYYDGRWWLFFTLSQYRGQALQELHLAFSDHLLGPWQLHPKNPVKTDRSSARPGGTPFFHDGYLFRPAQDCSKTYGGGVAINKILTLNPYEFYEETIKTILPIADSPYTHGLHTLSCSGNQFTLLDGLHVAFTPFKFVSTWRRRWFRMRSFMNHKFLF